MRYPLKELWFKSGVVIVKYKTKWKSYLKKKSNKKHLIDLNLKVKNRLQTKKIKKIKTNSSFLHK